MTSHCNTPLQANKKRMKQARKADKQRCSEEERKAACEEKVAEASLNQACMQNDNININKKVRLAIHNHMFKLFVPECISFVA